MENMEEKVIVRVKQRDVTGPFIKTESLSMAEIARRTKLERDAATLMDLVRGSIEQRVEYVKGILRNEFFADNMDYTRKRNSGQLNMLQRLKYIIGQAVDEIQKEKRLARAEAESKWTPDLIKYSFNNSKELYVDSDLHNGGGGLVNRGKEMYFKYKGKGKLNLSGKREFTPIEVEALCRIMKKPLRTVKPGDFQKMLEEIEKNG